MIDLHAHYLPGVDDGPTELQTTLSMLRAAEKDGTTKVVATPHQRHPAGYDVPAGAARERFQEVCRAAEEAGLGIELSLAAEIHFSERIPEGIREGELLALSPEGRYFLFELPVTSIPGNIFDVVFGFQTAGCFPVLAHPERNFEIMQRPKIARKLREQGVLLQLTAQSVTGEFGRRSEKAARTLLRWGVVDLLASDMHNADRRPPGLSRAVKRASKWIGAGAAERLVTENPSRVLQGRGVD